MVLRKTNVHLKQFLWIFERTKFTVGRGQWKTWTVNFSWSAIRPAYQRGNQTGPWPIGENAQKSLKQERANARVQSKHNSFRCTIVMIMLNPQWIFGFSFFFSLSSFSSGLAFGFSLGSSFRSLLNRVCSFLIRFVVWLPVRFLVRLVLWLLVQLPVPNSSFVSFELLPASDAFE